MDNKIDLLKTFGFLTFLGSFSFCVYKLRQVQNKYKKLRDLPVKQIKDLKKIENNQSNSQFFLKFLIQYTPQLSYKIPVYSNQRQFCQPSDKIVLQKYKQDIIKLDQKWKITSQKNSKGIIKEVKGFGQIYGDICEFNRIYKEEEMSFLGTVWSYFSYSLQMIFDFFRNYRKKSLNVKRQPFFLGSLIGYLHYQINFVSDTYLIIKCHLDDNAPSKEFVLNELKSKIGLNFFISALLLIGTIVSGKFVYHMIKTKVNQWKTKKLAQAGTFLNPSQIPDDKLCIICYDACRNAVFMDCRHCVLCANCSKVYKEDICPICKHQIDSIKLIYNCK